MRKYLKFLLLAIFLCTGSAHAAATDKLDVVASFSILADLVNAVGGEHVRVHALVGPDQDAHGYQPRPSDARKVRDAALVVANGLGFDGWIERLARSAGQPRPVLIASQGVSALTSQPGAEHDHHHDHKHIHGKAHDHHHMDGVDPHAWQDVANAIIYVRNIADGLIAADPAHAADYRANAERYIAELQALDADIRRALAALPAERRKVVTSHDAFGYFERAYGLRFIAAHGVASNAEPSAQDIAQLIRQIRAEKIPAAFLENVTDPRLIERIRKESGARLGGTLYSDALSAATGPAPTYIAMMRHNLATLLAGLAAVSDK